VQLENLTYPPISSSKLYKKGAFSFVFIFENMCIEDELKEA
jgi:hypothetical protein